MFDPRMVLNLITETPRGKMIIYGSTSNTLVKYLGITMTKYNL